LADRTRIWLNPRDGKAWRVERAWVEPGPYRAAGSREAERLLVASVRFLHPMPSGQAAEIVTSVRLVRDDLQDISDEELLMLFDEANRAAEE
jgi:hypothetical protein